MEVVGKVNGEGMAARLRSAEVGEALSGALDAALGAAPGAVVGKVKIVEWRDKRS